MNAAAAFTDLDGRVVDGRFRLLRRLGGTEESALYLTELEGNPARKAAIKLVAAGAPDAEARLAGWTAIARLTHPNLIRVFNDGRCGLDGNRVVYAVTEFADEVLAGVLAERALTLDETREMLMPVLKALVYLNAQGYVHGRLKPSNVLVIEDRLRISAECIALAASAGVERELSTVYDAPELARGVILPAADIWSLGMTLVAALTQKPAEWEPKSSEDPVLPDTLPEPYATIARRCLRIDPAQRCALDQIMEILDPQPVGRPAKRRITPQVRRDRWRAAIVATGVVAFAVLAGTFVHWPKATAPGPAGVEQPAGTAKESPPREVKPAPAGRLHEPIAGSKAGADKTSAGPAADSDGVVKRVMPDVLPAAQQTILGHVNVGVRVTVDEAGNVTDAALESPSGSKYFNRLSLEAARQWVFVAADTASSPATRAWTLRFDYHPERIDVSATPE